MPNLSQMKRERMMAFLQKIKDEHRDDDEMLIALGEIESELNAKKYGLVWEQHEEKILLIKRLRWSWLIDLLMQSFVLLRVQITR